MGLTAAQFPIIMLLAKEQNIMQERLVRHYHLDKGTIARSVRKLEDAGYIRRITDPANRRAVRLFLTGKGEDAVPVLRAINNDWETLAYRTLTAQDKTIVNVLMHTIAGNCLTYMKKSGGPLDAGE
ncbi:MarR family transcriptional regulator [Methanoregula sp.]|uniref:MarR family winged helix-turn-helix transcriptional regulator n=1 Tax=Methanoregula sp. TaxID=2052170 RepID=UPI0023731445|nr:MarR family transcriptional regulator [Methanoregula sp.]MDD1686338.1 MarR family transcriptional regulator [Methanoregula sp.]